GNAWVRRDRRVRGAAVPDLIGLHLATRVDHIPAQFFHSHVVACCYGERRPTDRGVVPAFAIRRRRGWQRRRQCLNRGGEGITRNVHVDRRACWWMFVERQRASVARSLRDRRGKHDVT